MGLLDGKSLYDFLSFRLSEKGKKEKKKKGKRKRKVFGGKCYKNSQGPLSICYTFILSA